MYLKIQSKLVICDELSYQPQHVNSQLSLGGEKSCACFLYREAKETREVKNVYLTLLTNNCDRTTA